MNNKKINKLMIKLDAKIITVVYKYGLKMCVFKFGLTSSSDSLMS